MPDLDLIKQGEQEARDRRGRVLRIGEGFRSTQPILRAYGKRKPLIGRRHATSASVGRVMVIYGGMMDNAGCRPSSLA
jgi:hypothetical protein